MGVIGLQEIVNILEMNEITEGEIPGKGIKNRESDPGTRAEEPQHFGLIEEIIQ